MTLGLVKLDRKEEKIVSVEERFDAAVALPDLVRCEGDWDEWVSAEKHQAPSRSLPIDTAIDLKTNAGLLTVMAGCLVLCAKRLAASTDTTPCYRMAEALLCYEADYSVKTRFSEFPKEVRSPAAAAAVWSVTRAAARVFHSTANSHSKYPPNQHFKNVMFMTRTILGKDNQRAFRKWMKLALARLDLLAACPDLDRLPKNKFATEDAWVASRRKNFGPPVPIEVLQPAEPPQAEELPALYAEFLKAVDFEANPFLKKAPAYPANIGA